ncbi:hypothetical protein CEXT_672541 [Caerostris extrusa]|uniref:Uncharacterized protein n=1 Tax=Caerostris extrusa TaxID=172846 RepID=A0AAV4N6Z4_CAEEX|nr:hypothetical protein CEXT_672541 [Caerostris extrusa]
MGTCTHSVDTGGASAGCATFRVASDQMLVRSPSGSRGIGRASLRCAPSHAASSPSLERISFRRCRTSASSGPCARAGVCGDGPLGRISCGTGRRRAASLRSGILKKCAETSDFFPESIRSKLWEQYKRTPYRSINNAESADRFTRKDLQARGSRYIRHLIL